MHKDGHVAITEHKVETVADLGLVVRSAEYDNAVLGGGANLCDVVEAQRLRVAVGDGQGFEAGVVNYAIGRGAAGDGGA